MSVCGADDGSRAVLIVDLGAGGSSGRMVP